MSRKSESNLVVVIVVALVGGVCWILKCLWDALTKLSTPSTPKTDSTQIQEGINKARFERQRLFEEQQRKRTEEMRKKKEEEDQRWEELRGRASSLGERDIIFKEDIEQHDKVKLLGDIFNYSPSEAQELLETAEKEARRAKLQKAKKAISRKAFELYGGIPSDDKRAPIPDEIKQYVWQRDRGQCAKCQSQENIEFDHIIPISVGGGNTARNIQILCENCNRSKSDSVV